MSRSGYSDDCDGAELALWRGAVNRAINGKRGQAFLREMLEALDALPEKRLISHVLSNESGEVCAIGSVGKKRGADMGVNVEPDRHDIERWFGIAPALAAEIMFINDDDHYWEHERSPESRFKIVRAWVAAQIRVAP